MNLHEYLTANAWSREDIDYFLDPEQPNWAQFDSVTGYRLSDIVTDDGIEGSSTINTYQPNFARTMVRYASEPCRINTYGDSFTQCHQVSDGETWQEVLAAHLGEPIRNFGVGGFGVYQAYRRMVQIEETADHAPYVILNVYDDDHIRNLDLARWFRIQEFRRAIGAGMRTMFHANPWAHLRLGRGHTFNEVDNPYPTGESLYDLCDPDAVYERFKDDEVIQLDCLINGIDIGDTARLDQLADQLDLVVDLAAPETRSRDAARLLDNYGLRATLYTLDLVREYLRQRDRKLLVLLSYSGQTVRSTIDGAARSDQELVDYLDAHDIRRVDGLTAHLHDAQAFRLDAAGYRRRYFNGGHYNPLGNHFFAFAIKPAIVDWLDPKPLPYRDLSRDADPARS